MPPMLHGDIWVNYSGSYEFGSLEENGDTHGKRQLHSENVDYGIEFSPITGVAINIELPTTMYLALAYPDAIEMIYEPVTGSGTYAFDDPLGTKPIHRGLGVNGVWFGAAFAPFSEAFKRRQQVTWRLDLGVRTGSKKNLWTVHDDMRGTSPGGTAVHIGAAFSAKKGSANPYMTFNYIYEGKVTADAVDENNQVVASGLTFKPPSTVDLRGGLEIVSFYDPQDESLLAFDLFLGFGYNSWSDVPSGLFLPSVLDASRRIAVSTSDYLTASAGFGIVGHATKFVGIETSFMTRYITPHRLEHPYPIRTGLDTVELAWNLSVTGKYR
jgi:hypothetical protein